MQCSERVNYIRYCRGMQEYEAPDMNKMNLSVMWRLPTVERFDDVCQYGEEVTTVT